MLEEIHNYRDCQIKDCPECERLIEEDFVMACDNCGNPGAKEGGGWVTQPDGQIFCWICDDKLNKQKFEHF